MEVPWKTVEGWLGSVGLCGCPLENCSALVLVVIGTCGGGSRLAGTAMGTDHTSILQWSTELQNLLSEIFNIFSTLLTQTKIQIVLWCRYIATWFKSHFRLMCFDMFSTQVARNLIFRPHNGNIYNCIYRDYDYRDFETLPRKGTTTLPKILAPAEVRALYYWNNDISSSLLLASSQIPK